MSVFISTAITKNTGKRLVRPLLPCMRPFDLRCVLIHWRQPTLQIPGRHFYLSQCSLGSTGVFNSDFSNTAYIVWFFSVDEIACQRTSLHQRGECSSTGLDHLTHILLFNITIIAINYHHLFLHSWIISVCHLRITYSLLVQD